MKANVALKIIYSISALEESVKYIIFYKTYYTYRVYQNRLLRLSLKKIIL